MTEPRRFSRGVAVIGGCGHVGLPLAFALADRGASVAIYDINADSVKTVNAGQLPFTESGAQTPLERAVADGRLEATTDPEVIASAENVIVVIGTPVDEYLNPDQRAIVRALEGCASQFADGQLLILRSTVYPGATALVEKFVSRLGRDIDVAFCPERIAQGRAMAELDSCRR